MSDLQPAEGYIVGDGRTLWRFRSHGCIVVTITKDGKHLQGRARVSDKGLIVLELIDPDGEVRARQVAGRPW